MMKHGNWLRTTWLPMVGAALLVAGAAAGQTAIRHPHNEGWEMRNGRFYDNGEWVFLKIAKPLYNFGDAETVDQLIDELDILEEKNYNTIELNCYWHHFEESGDGEIEVSLEPLAHLINAIHDRGMYPCLSVETYAVGGGVLPIGLWETHPEAVAVNSDGEEVYDSEYGFGSRVPSQFSPAYLEASRRFIRNLTAGLPYQKLLYFETTVEPQYIGNQSVCYSPHARAAYEKWVDAKDVADAPEWPEEFPKPAAFVQHPVWNQFRAEALADWVNKDADAFRAVAGDDAWIAVDYLETGGPEMPNRLGNPVVFLENLRDVRILQVNWHWNKRTRSPNTVAYENVAVVNRDWAVSEHMTMNGSDYNPSEVEDVLQNTLRNGTRFGWEFVSVSASSGSFSHYNEDWSPKPLIAEVDNNWEYWMEQVRSED